MKCSSTTYRENKSCNGFSPELVYHHMRRRKTPNELLNFAGIQYLVSYRLSFSIKIWFVYTSRRPIVYHCYYTGTWIGEKWKKIRKPLAFHTVIELDITRGGSKYFPHVRPSISKRIVTTNYYSKLLLVLSNYNYIIFHCILSIWTKFFSDILSRRIHDKT